MTRSELIQTLAQTTPDLTLADWEAIVDTIFGTISDAIAKGNRIELRGFGAFSVRERTARIGRNPRTGEQVEVAPKKTPYFRPGKKLRDRVNGQMPDPVAAAKQKAA